MGNEDTQVQMVGEDLVVRDHVKEVPNKAPVGNQCNVGDRIDNVYDVGCQRAKDLVQLLFQRALGQPGTRHKKQGVLIKRSPKFVKWPPNFLFT